MPNSKKITPGEKPMSKAGTASNRTEAPLLGEAALDEALKEFGVSPNGPAASSVNAAANDSGANRDRRHRRRKRCLKCWARSLG